MFFNIILIIWKYFITLFLNVDYEALVNEVISNFYLYFSLMCSISYWLFSNFAQFSFISRLWIKMAYAYPLYSLISYFTDDKNWLYFIYLFLAFCSTTYIDYIIFFFLDYGWKHDNKNGRERYSHSNGK